MLFSEKEMFKYFDFLPWLKCHTIPGEMVMFLSVQPKFGYAYANMKGYVNSHAMLVLTQK